MSIGPASGIAGSAAGAPLSQSKSKDVEQAQRETAAQQRQVDTERQAENAAGIGQTQEDSEASERDADGRRLWEQAPQKPGDEPASDEEQPPGKRSIDPTGTRGEQLDLTG